MKITTSKQNPRRFSLEPYRHPQPHVDRVPAESFSPSPIIPEPGDELPRAAQLPDHRSLPTGPRSSAARILTAGGAITTIAAIGTGLVGGLNAALAVGSVLGVGTSFLAAAHI